MGVRWLRVSAWGGGGLIVKGHTSSFTDALGGLNVPCPNLEIAVPRTRTKAIAVSRDAKTGDTILMGRKNTYTLSSKGIPNHAIKVIIASKKQPATSRKVDARDATLNGVMHIKANLAVIAKIKESTSAVI